MLENGDLEALAGEDGAPGEVNERRVRSPSAVLRRVWRNIFVIVTIGVGAAAVLASPRVLLGVALGGGLALLNFKWLEGSLRGVLSQGTEKTPPGTRMKLILRWTVVGAIGYLAYATGYFDPAGILAGLFAPAIAVMIEAAYQTFKTLGHDGEH